MPKVQETGRDGGLFPFLSLGRRAGFLFSNIRAERRAFFALAPQDQLQDFVHYNMSGYGVWLLLVWERLSLKTGTPVVERRRNILWNHARRCRRIPSERLPSAPQTNNAERAFLPNVQSTP